MGEQPVFSNVVGILNEFNPEVNSWLIHQKRVQQYFIANKITDSETKRAILLNGLHEEAYKLLCNLTVPKDPEDCTYETLVTTLKNHYTPVRAVFAERFRFYVAQKQLDESLQDWAARVKKLSTHCNFGEYLETAIRDKFVVGLEPGKVRDKLFSENESELTFVKALSTAMTAETARLSYGIQEQQTISIKSEPGEVHRLGSFSKGNARGRGRSCSPRGAHQGTSTADRWGQRSRASVSINQRSATTNTCTVCGKKNHNSENCRYREYSCNSCGKKGHLQSVCDKKGQQLFNAHHFLEDNELPIFNLSAQKNLPFMVDVKLNNDWFLIELDTGATVSVLSEFLWFNKFRNQQLVPSELCLVSYTGDKIWPIGKCQINVTYNNVIKNIDFYVIKNGGPPLLGRNFTYEFKLNLTNVNYLAGGVDAIFQEYPEVFTEKLGTFKTQKLHLSLKDGATPKFFRPRPLPYALKKRVDEELENLIKNNIIESVPYSDWGTPIVPVIKKDGSVRICGDYKVTLNQQIKVDSFPLPRVEDLLARVQGGEQFSKIDLSHAYQQLLLDDSSKDLTTISTHKGLFRYLRLPFGVSSAPAQFQRIMERLFINMKNVCCFLDDILVTGKDRKEHMFRLKEVLNVLRNHGLTVKKDKCSFFQDSVTYLGYIINKKGITKSPEKVKAIVDAPLPENVTQLKSFLGLINYYHKFIPSLPNVLYPLYQLIKKDTIWEWNNDCQIAFDKIKELMISPQILVHYNPELKVNLTVDASDKGLGAILTHVYPDGSEKPIAFASRTLIDAEKRYSQIDKEATAIVFGVKKYHQYLYGRKFCLLTDHRPLVSIFGPKRGIPMMMANRLQRYALFLSGYDFEIQYVSSSRNRADCLSRLPIGTNETEFESAIGNIKYLSNTELPLNTKDIKEATQTDAVLKEIYDYVLLGWPEIIKDNNILPYFRRKDEITAIDGILLWGYRVIVPKKLQSSILKELHVGHAGIVKTKSLSRSYVWWPELNTDIENLCRSCENCQRLRANPPKSTTELWPVSKGWERIHLDFLGPVQGKYFLVLIDSYTKWLEVFRVSSISSAQTIKILREIFSRFGLPKLLVTDNGTQLVSNEFEFFLKENGIKHITSPPYYPMCNGAAENSVKTVKNYLLKEISQFNTTDLDRSVCAFLMRYRNSIHCTTGETPARLMLGRPLRTRLDLIRPDNIGNRPNYTDAKIIQNLENARLRQKRNFKGCKRRNFEVGELVLVRDYRFSKPSWSKAIVSKLLGKRTYDVIIPNTTIKWKRHINQMLYCKDPDDLPIGLSFNNNVDVKKTNNDIVNNNETDLNVVEEPEIDQAKDKMLCNDQFLTPRRSTRIKKFPQRFQYD